MNQEPMPHQLTLSQRSKLTMTGVSEVISFDENSVVLQTALGTLVVQGESLQLKTLSPEGGQVAVDGEIASLCYEQQRAATGLLRRLFG